MSDQIQCPAPDPMHSAGVKYQGILKHIYKCRYLKKTIEQTSIYQCQYCLTNHFLYQYELEKHQKKCGLNKTYIKWNDKLNLLIIEPDPNGKFTDVKQPQKPLKSDEKQPPKNWEYYRDLKLKKKLEKRLGALQLSNENSCSQNQSRSISPSRIESPKQQKKFKTDQLSFSVSQNSSQKISHQEKLRIENEEKTRQKNLEELKSRAKVDDYQQITYII